MAIDASWNSLYVDSNNIHNRGLPCRRQSIIGIHYCPRLWFICRLLPRSCMWHVWLYQIGAQAGFVPPYPTPPCDPTTPAHTWYDRLTPSLMSSPLMAFWGQPWIYYWISQEATVSVPITCWMYPRSLPFAVWSSQFWNFTVCPPTTLAGVCVPAYNINYSNLNTWANCIPEYHKALCSIPSYALMTEMGFFSLLTHAIHSYPNMERSSLFP